MNSRKPFNNASPVLSGGSEQSVFYLKGKEKKVFLLKCKGSWLAEMKTANSFSNNTICLNWIIMKLVLRRMSRTETNQIESQLHCWLMINQGQILWDFQSIEIPIRMAFLLSPNLTCHKMNLILPENCLFFCSDFVFYITQYI